MPARDANLPVALLAGVWLVFVHVPDFVAMLRPWIVKDVGVGTCVTTAPRNCHAVRPTPSPDGRRSSEPG